MLCANPDFLSPAKPGMKETFQPGHVARFFQERSIRVKTVKDEWNLHKSLLLHIIIITYYLH